MNLISDLASGVVQFLFGASVYSKGFDQELTNQRIYYANHSSHLDALLIWASLTSELQQNTRPVAASDYWGNGGIRTFIACKLFHSILIDRTGTKEQDPLEPIRRALKEGSSIIIFPEGTRSLDGELKEFKSGLYHLALEFKDIELTPVYLYNVDRILPKGELLPVPLFSRVIFGGPTLVKENEDKKDFLTRVRKHLLELAP